MLTMIMSVGIMSGSQLTIINSCNPPHSLFRKSTVPIKLNDNREYKPFYYRKGILYFDFAP